MKRLILAALLVASPATAADWWIVLQRDVQGNAHLADTSQLRREGDIVTFWTHIFYRDLIGEMKSARIQFEVNCRTHSTRERRFIDFNSARQTIETGDNGHNGWREVAPDTAGSLNVEFACAQPEQRLRRFVRVDRNADVFAIGEFFSDPRELTTTTTRDPQPSRQ